MYLVRRVLGVISGFHLESSWRTFLLLFFFFFKKKSKIWVLSLSFILVSEFSLSWQLSDLDFSTFSVFTDFDIRVNFELHNLIFSFKWTLWFVSVISIQRWEKQLGLDRQYLFVIMLIYIQELNCFIIFGLKAWNWRYFWEQLYHLSIVPLLEESISISPFEELGVTGKSQSLWASFLVWSLILSLVSFW